MATKVDQHLVDDAYPEPHPHLTTLTAPSTTATPTSAMMDLTSSYNQAVTSYSLDLHPAGHQPPPYYADYEWQHHGAPATTSAPQAIPDPHGAFYGFADRPELTLYHTFPSGVSHADLYGASTPALWPHGPSPALVEDPTQINAALAVSQRYLPSRTVSATSSASSSHSPSSSSSSPPGHSSKPKRRRVQSTTQRKAANVRERRRMFHLNTAFDELRKRLPAFNYEKRLSRIETLRLAMTYIGFMKDVTLGEDPRKVKLRPGNHSDACSDLSQVDMESCTSEDAHHDDLDS